MTSVMVDGRYLGNKPSGIGRYTAEVVAAMQQQRRSIEWRWITRQPDDHGTLRAARVVLLDAEAYGPATSFGLRLRLGPNPAELFHSPFHVLPVGLRCPTVVTIHDVFNFTQPQTSNYSFPVSWLEWGYFLWAIPESLRRASRVVCVSETTADLLAERLPWVRDKLRVVHHGVTSRFQRLADRAAVERECRQLVGGGPFVLSIGGISPNKNHPRMLAAFARAFPDPEGPKLVTVSRFGKPDGLRRRARALDIDERWVSVRAPDDDQVVSLLNGALALLFCSIVEGFGMPILEAMACGCPVLTSSASCMPEVAGGAALLAAPRDVGDMANKLRQLARDEDLRSELEQRGLDRAAEFTWQRAAQLHLEVYDEALRHG